MELELFTLVALFGVALIAGFADAIAGGGGSGRCRPCWPPACRRPWCLAPTSCRAVSAPSPPPGSMPAGFLEWAIIWPAVICTFIGAAIGTLAGADHRRRHPGAAALPADGLACYFYFSPGERCGEPAPPPMASPPLVGGGMASMTASSGRARGRFCHRLRGPGGLWHGQGHRPHLLAELHLQHRLPALLHPGARWCGRGPVHGAGAVHRGTHGLQAGAQERGEAHPAAAAGDRLPADVRQNWCGASTPNSLPGWADPGTKDGRARSPGSGPPVFSPGNSGGKWTYRACTRRAKCDRA